MAIILNIHTGLETALVILSSGNEIIAEEENATQNSHASFLEPAIQKIFAKQQLNLSSIDAVAVVNGPGSYTGLRIGLASAKALCYALGKPLILLNTLDVMACALKLQANEQQNNILFCPMIDARRMEVFTALYDEDLNIVKPYAAEILDIHFLEEERKKKPVVIGGNGSEKLRQLTNSKDFIYINSTNLSQPIVNLSDKAFYSRKFSNAIYSEPFYLKPVYFNK